MNLQAATNQLDRILGFFPRVERKAAFLFALDTANLAFIAINVHRGDMTTWYISVPGALATVLLFASIFFIYRCLFPNLAGGSASLFYFREIARRTEGKFIDEFASQDEKQLQRDALGQVWRNAEILTMKFNALKVAFLLTAISIVPMTVFLAAAAWTHQTGLTFR